jgi:chromosome segregation ATPase
MKICEDQNHIIALRKNWKDSLTEITALRDELTSTIVAAAGSEHSVKDDSEPPVVTQADEAVHYIPDFSLLKHMSYDDFTAHLRSEWLKLQREHESEMQKKTEELFRLKRDFARDGAVLPIRKERELQFIKSKLIQTISKMDGMVARREGSDCFDCSEDDELRRLKDRIGSLLDENERLRGLLADKRKEAKQLSSQESKLSDRVEKLSSELDDLKIESYMKDLVEASVLREVFGDYENQIDDGNQEECLLRELIMEKEEQLRAMSGDRSKLKYENDQLVSIVGSTLVQHHEEFDLVNDELTMFREKVCEQELLILEFKSESSSIKSCLYEALQQIHVCKQEICGLTESLTSMSIALEEAKEQNASLDATVRQMKTTSAPCVDGHIGHPGHLEFDLVSMEKLSNAYSDFESRFAQRMKQNEVRCANSSMFILFCYWYI